MTLNGKRRPWRVSALPWRFSALPWRFSALALSLLCAACAAPKVLVDNPVVNTVLNRDDDTVTVLTLVAAEDVNPNFVGEPSPIVLVLYELTDAETFAESGFNELFYREGTLDKTVRERLEFRIEPGEVLTTERTLDPETRHLGLVAGYRQIEGKRWRLLAEVEPEEEQEHVFVVSDGSVSAATATPRRSRSRR